MINHLTLNNKLSFYMIKIATITLGILIAVVLFCCKKKECQPQEKLNCGTTLEYDPVCGCDGSTYSNPGVANCNSITDYSEGPCNK